MQTHIKARAVQRDTALFGLPDFDLPAFDLADAPGEYVTLTFEGQPMRAPKGVSVAAALLMNGVGAFRATPVQSAARAPYCMMGVCFDCLLDIDGMPNRQSCLIPVRDGMVVKYQAGAAYAPCAPCARKETTKQTAGDRRVE